MAPQTWASKILTADGLVFTGRCVIHGVLVGTDGTNDVTVALHNSLDNSGDKIIPSITIDAANDGYGGLLDLNAGCNVGCYLDLTLAAGSCEVVVYFSKD
jgi:hypothetical protein